MIYMKVQWKHSFSNEPIIIYSELNEDRNEIKKVEIYRDGMMGYACQDVSVNGSALSECEIPELSEINADPQFEGIEIHKEEFEAIWKKVAK